MKDSSRGGIIVLVLLVALAGYFVIWAPGCSPSAPPDGDGTDGGTTTPSKAKVGEIAPDFSHTTVSGDTIVLSEFIGDKPVLLDFWATWCGPCMLELPVLQEFYDENSDKLEIIAITSEPLGDLVKIERALEEKGITFPAVHDVSREISKMFPTNGIPYLVFIGADGKVIETHMGFSPEIADKIKDVYGFE